MTGPLKVLCQQETSHGYWSSTGLLTLAGCVVRTCDVRDVLAEAASFRPDVCVLDVTGAGVVRRHCEAFRIGLSADVVYGFQFHPELTETKIREEKWLNRLPIECRPTPDQVTAAVTAGGEVLNLWAERASARRP